MIQTYADNVVTKDCDVRIGWDEMAEDRRKAQDPQPTAEPLAVDGYSVGGDLAFVREELIQLLRHWEQSRGGRELPTRADLLPITLPRVLPWLVMLDVINGGAEFRFRLCGTAIADILGFEPRGETLSVLPEQLAERITVTGRYCIETRVPLRGVSSKSSMPGQEFQGTEICCLPVSNDGKTIDILVMAAMLPNRR